MRAIDITSTSVAPLVRKGVFTTLQFILSHHHVSD